MNGFSSWVKHVKQLNKNKGSRNMKKEANTSNKFSELKNQQHYHLSYTLPKPERKNFYKLRTHKLIHLYRTFLATPLQKRFDIQNSSFNVTSKVTDSRAVSRQQPGIFFSIFPKKHYAVVVLQISWLFMTQYAKSPIFCFITQTMETYVSFEFSTRR